jgi:flagellar biosynthesis GTPase FlhF
MTIRKLPPEAYSYYLSLGIGRSYSKVAKHYGVQKSTVTEHAVQENWQEKIEAAERDAQAAAEKKAQESIQEMNERHLKTAQLVQRKALEDMRTQPFASSIDATRALFLGMDKERLVRGEPTDRVDIAQLIKRECESLILKPGEEEDWDDDAAPEQEDAVPPA